MAAALASPGALCSLQAAPTAFSTPEVSCASCGTCPLFSQPSSAQRSRTTFRSRLHATFSAPTQSVSNRSQRKRSTIVRAAEKEDVPSWAKPGSEEVPPWAKEDKAGYQQEGPTELPFGVYLLLSVFTTIAAVGSIYEYSNKNPIFGVITPDSGLYAPILGFFAVSGFPTAAFLLYKAISSANKLAENMDKEDGVNRR